MSTPKILRLWREPPPWIDLALTAAIVLAALLFLAPGLGHPSIHNWDESAHQAATRGTYASFFKPHIYDLQLYPVTPNEWLQAGVFLHKPTGPFWFGALAMHFIGVTPLGLRLGSWLGELAAALAIFFLARRIAGRSFALLGALIFLALPFGYELCQGYIFGDATDCTLVGWIATAMALLVIAIEKDDPRIAAAAGAATGLGYLCKTALALAPAGVGVAFFAAGALGLVKPLRWRGALLFLGALLLVAVPWNLYTAWAFPDVYRYEAAVTVHHLFTNEFAQWVRPIDAIFNEIAETEVGPIPTAVPLLALGWGLWRAARKRETEVLAVVLWVAASWTVLSIAHVKVPGTAWGAVPGALVLIAILFGDAAANPALAGALGGALAAPMMLHLVPTLSQLARGLPTALVQTRTHPQLSVGLGLAAIGAAVAFLIGRAARRIPAASAVGVPALALLGIFGLVQVVQAQSARATELSKAAPMSPMREVGRALAQTLPEQSVIFLGVDRDPGCCFDVQDLIFWSGRSVYRRDPDLATAAAHGLHPFLVSVAAEPYAPVPGVPAFAAARAYDLGAPASPAPLPADLTPLDVKGGGYEVLGFSSGARDGDHDIWAFYVRAGPSFAIPVTFETASGEQRATLTPADTLSNPQRWNGKPWFVVTALGPHRDQVKRLQVNGTVAFGN